MFCAPAWNLHIPDETDEEGKCAASVQMQRLNEVIQDCSIAYFTRAVDFFFHAALSKRRPSALSEEHLPKRSRRSRCTLETKQQRGKLLSSAQQSKNLHGHISFGVWKKALF